MAPMIVTSTCTVTDSVHTPSMSPHLQVKPDQIAIDAIAATEASASILHLHDCDPNDERPTADPDVFMQFLQSIKQATDAVLNISTGDSLLMTLDQRPASPLRAQPEMCSLNIGSMNGLFPMLARLRKWQHNWEREPLVAKRDTIFKNTFADLESVPGTLGQGCGTRFQLECYDASQRYSPAHLHDHGLVSRALLLQFVLCILGAVGADPGNLILRKRIGDKLFGDRYQFSVLAAGRHQLPLISIAAAMGGNVRVGLDDRQPVQCRSSAPHPRHSRRSMVGGCAARRSARDACPERRGPCGVLRRWVREGRPAAILSKSPAAASQTVSLRPGRANDVETIHAALLRLGAHIGAHHEIKSTPEDLRRYGFGDKPAFSALIAEVNGEFAGLCLHFPIFSTWMGRSGVYVQDLYVEDRFRGRRIGEKLLRRVARECRAAGGVYLRLSVDTDNETAKAFYEKLAIRWSDHEQVQKIVGDTFFAFADAPEE